MSQDDLQLPDDVEQLKAMVAEQAVAIDERDASLAERESVLRTGRQINVALWSGWDGSIIPLWKSIIEYSCE